MCATSHPSSYLRVWIDNRNLQPKGRSHTCEFVTEACRHAHALCFAEKHRYGRTAHDGWGWLGSGGRLINGKAHAASFTAVGIICLFRAPQVTCDKATPVFWKVALRCIAHNAPSRLAGFRVNNGVQGKT